MKIKIVSTSKHELPAYETVASAGMDLRANIEEPIILKPLERTLVPTGLYIELPIGYEAQVRPRSGLAVKHGISLVNTPGTIDNDYRGQVCVPLINHGREPVTITRSMRIAQLIIKPVPRTCWQEVDELPETDRGPVRGIRGPFLAGLQLYLLPPADLGGDQGVISRGRE